MFVQLCAWRWDDNGLLTNKLYMVNDVIPVWNPENLPGNKNWIPVSGHWDDILLVEIALKSQCSYSYAHDAGMTMDY
ncbi:hypothetical protein [Wolbachia endosymbiont (group A) of Brachyopa scutellaris]|uniref:hypothetical protein n=1 Tax=Wolbachia endosymbiont (group A) of Brachyopa scutellaris TaxID=3066140 RepID=UPI003132CE24